MSALELNWQRHRLNYFDHTLEVIQQLKLNHSLYIVTNGVTETQLRRIAQTQFNEIFQDVFISEQTGFQNR